MWHMLHVAYHPISRHCGSNPPLSPSPLVCFLFLLIHIRMSAPFPLPILARTEEQEDRQIPSQSESPLVQRDHDIFSLPSLPHFNFPLFLSSLFFTPSIPPSVLSTHQFGPPQQWWLEITTEHAVHMFCLSNRTGPTSLHRPFRLSSLPW